MLNDLDLDRKLGKEAWKAAKDEYEVRLGMLQRQAKEHGIPIIIVFEGLDAAGKGTLINNLILPLDPRGYTVYSTQQPSTAESLRPFLWRFWCQTPAKGRMTIFDRSWYQRILNARVEEDACDESLHADFRDIKAFERQLADDGAIIIKFWLHITKDVQKKRFKKLLENKATAWRVCKDDRRRHKAYDAYISAAEDAIARTDSDYAPWTIVEAHDQRFATVKIITTLMTVLEQRLNEIAGDTHSHVQLQVDRTIPDNLHSSLLDKVDLSLKLERDDYKKQLKRKQALLHDLEHELYMRRIPVVLVYEGWDAAGKGGNIRRLVRELDPRGYEVVPIAAPNDIELKHHYLWRFWTQMPKGGHITIFDRSWYGRVLVERVEGFCSAEEWQRAYREINEMEAHLAGFDTIVLKFWLHIDKEEQLDRFKARQVTEHKQWKITDEDWRNREKWDQYHTAVDDMLLRTSSPHAPWIIVESNDKLHARIKVIDTVIAAIQAKLKTVDSR